MPRVSGVVSSTNKQQVKTKYGFKDTYTFTMDGTEYRTSFKDHGLSAGDVVEFEYEVIKYGNEVLPKNAPEIIKKGSGPAPAPAARPTVVSTGGGRMGVFPIPALDGSRAINRQNALTNAIKFAEITGTATSVGNVIDIARQFEAYTCGDLDMAAAAKAASDEKVAA